MAERGSDKRGLGRGLSALMGDVGAMNDIAQPAPKTGERQIPIEAIAANPNQPRRRFEEEALRDLANSIRERGIIQPIILREYASGDAKYQIVAGERRWRAAQMAQLHEVPAIIRVLSDEEAMEVAIIENIQRDDLNPVEEAEGYRRLMESHGRTQEEMSQALGKSRSHIANMLRLLNLPEEVRNYLAEGQLSIGQARALITTDDPVALARTVIAKGLSVREVERLSKPKPARSISSKQRIEKDADTRAIEDELSASVGVRVSIDSDASGQSGKLSIKYKSLEELDDLCRRLSNVRAGTI